MRRGRSSGALAVVLALGVWTARVDAQGAGGSGAAFLLVPVGARATGLGQAGLTDKGTSESAFWNPAGLATLPGSEFAIHYVGTFISNNAALTGHLVSDRVGVFGIAAYLVDYGSQDVIPPGQTSPTGRLASRNIELIGSYATRVNGAFAIGLNYKLVQFRNDCSGDCRPRRTIVGTTHAVDLGVQWQTADDRLRLAATLRHAGFPLQLENRDQADPLPTRLALGASWSVPVSYLQDGTPLDARLHLNVQDAWGEYTSPDALIGAELGYGEQVALRAGYALVNSEGRGPSVGFGVRLERVAIDFARVFYESGTFDDPAYLSFRVLW